jgi:hypothetical protein
MFWKSKTKGAGALRKQASPGDLEAICDKYSEALSELRALREENETLKAFVLKAEQDMAYIMQQIELLKKTGRCDLISTN